MRADVLDRSVRLVAWCPAAFLAVSGLGWGVAGWMCWGSAAAGGDLGVVWGGRVRVLWGEERGEWGWGGLWRLG